MLTQVVEGDHGTARALKNDFVRLAGKTGTCNSIDTITKQYVTSKQRLAFCGFFPVENPKYSMIVLTYYPTKNMFGAARTSGIVVKNMAQKLYTRGLLDSDIELASEKSPGNSSPTFIASSSNYEQLKSTTKTEKGKKYAAGNGKDANGVPKVLNFGLRDAIARLEAAGYDVKFKGEGHVVAQNLIGRNLVELTLSNLQ